MRFLMALFFGSRSATNSGADGTCHAADATIADAAPRALELPTRRDDVEEWEAPIARKMPARAHVDALVAMFQHEGRTGLVPHWDLTSLYPECAWMHGFEQLTERQLQLALGKVLAKERHDVLDDDGNSVRTICYVIPAPAWANPPQTQSAAAGNVVPMRTKARRQAKASLSAERGQRNEARRTQSAGRKARYRADIAEAVACNQ